MSQNETQQTQAAAEEISQAQLSEAELESVSGGSSLLVVAPPLVVTLITPALVASLIQTQTETTTAT